MLMRCVALVYTIFAASVLAGNSVLRSLFGAGKHFSYPQTL